MNFTVRVGQFCDCAGATKPVTMTNAATKDVRGRMIILGVKSLAGR
jgi:hypothetical protein